MAVTTALVLGGGLAGVAAAVRLAEHGVKVTLVEAAKRLGGRASSFDDPVLGRTDRGQHVTMGCCHNHLDLLDRLDARDRWKFSTTQTWIDRRGTASRLAPSPLPVPLAFGPSIIGAKFLTLEDKARLAAAAPALLAGSPAPDETFEAYLLDNHQSPRLIEKLWEPVAVGACNMPSNRLSAQLGLSVVRRGFLASDQNASIGVASCPLADLYDKAAAIIEKSGGRVLLSTRAESFTASHARLRSGDTLTANRVIAALPPNQVARLGEVPGDHRLELCGRIETSPIICVHLLFDRPVMPDPDVPHAVLLDSTSDWLFRGGDGERIAGVISAASPLDDQSLDDIADRVLDDARCVLPEAREAGLIRKRAVRERDATFAAVPGLVRPTTTGNSPLLLAGDYTDTGWPATMEGATLSGYRAAAVALGLPEDALLA